MLKGNTSNNDVGTLIYYVALDPVDVEGALWARPPGTLGRDVLAGAEGVSAATGAFLLQVMPHNGTVLHTYILSTVHAGTHSWGWGTPGACTRGRGVGKGSCEGEVLEGRGMVKHAYKRPYILSTRHAGTLRVLYGRGVGVDY